MYITLSTLAFINHYLFTSLFNIYIFFFFFFQAEDGIRDYKVTGVQTCALPIFLAYTGDEHTLPVVRAEYSDPRVLALPLECGVTTIAAHCGTKSGLFDPERSEERRVGKECRSRWSPYH